MIVTTYVLRKGKYQTYQNAPYKLFNVLGSQEKLVET